MTRNRQSAKKAGSAFERLVADYLQVALANPNIDRKVKTGAKDKGDIANVVVPLGSFAIECKDYGGLFHVSEWLREAEIEQDNSGSDFGIVVAKRRGKTAPEEQVVFMTLETFVRMLGGS